MVKILESYCLTKEKRLYENWHELEDFDANLTAFNMPLMVLTLPILQDCAMEWKDRALNIVIYIVTATRYINLGVHPMKY